MADPAISKKVLSAFSALKEKASGAVSGVKEGVSLASIATKLLRNREQAKKKK